MQPSDAGPPYRGGLVVVTGAAGGIGEQIARRALEAGAIVVASDVDADALAAVRERLTLAGAASRPPVFWRRGADDRVIAEPAIARTASWLPLHATLDERFYPGLAHAIDATEAADARASVDAATRAI